MTRPADWEARARALDPEGSFIVQAPAGSGKTELLTQRMLGLLARVENPEEVVAITFTRKAAAEMAHRVLKRLDSARQAVDEGTLEPHEQLSRQLALAALENDRRLGWNLLEQPGRLRVRTIDSLCGDIARQLPVLSGLGGGQQVAEKPADLYRQAAVRTLAAIEDSSDELQARVARLLDRYDNQYDRLVDLLTSMLGSRDQWLDFLAGAGPDNDRQALETALADLVQSELQQALAAMPDWLLDELPRYLSFSIGNGPDDEEAVRALLDCWNPDGGPLQPGTDASDLPHWITLVDRLLTRSGTWLAAPNARQGFPAPSSAAVADRPRFQQWKDDFTGLLNRLRENDALCAQLNVVRRLPEPRYDDEAWESLEALLDVLVRAAAEWQLVMAESGSADFTEIARRAIRALGDDEAPSELALRLDYRIRHLLVDEFQDTSHSQIRLLERLTAGWSAGDGRSLFLVGDPMQSIYRFRKAEVSLFIQAFAGQLFGQLGLEPLRLTVNFRSTAPVVEWVNEHFPLVMPADNDPLTGAVSYSPAATRPGAGRNGTVQLHLRADRDDRGEALEVADIVRSCAADDRIAVLVRSRKQAAEILALFDRLKQEEPRFRYRAVKFNPLGETVLVQDLVALTLALIQPADRLAWLAVLRAPYCGLDLADIDILAAGAPVIPDAIEAFLANSLAGLGADGRSRLHRSGPVLAEAAGRNGRRSVRERVEATWLRLGGPACLQNRSELADAASFFDLLDTMESEGAAIDRETLVAYLEDLSAEPDADAGEGLQVMTIYSAKGLQFDTVILPGLNKGTRGNDGKLLHWFERAERNQVVMCGMRNQAEKARQKKSGDLIQYISGVERRRQAMEDGRLLYVAATRTVHSLHLLAAVPPNARGQVKARSGTLLGELWPAIEQEQAPKVLAAAEAIGEVNETGAPGTLPRLYRRLPPGWTVPTAPGLPAETTTDPVEPPESVEYRWAGEDARLTGELVHRLLQWIAESGEAAWRDSGAMAAREAWCRRRLKAEGVTGSRADAVVARTGQAVDTCLSSANGRRILFAGEESACELAITAVFGGAAVNLVLDRTYVENGERWVVDYKTSTHAGSGLEAFLESEADRYRPQLERYREAMALSESRPIRIALYFPLLDRFVEL